MRYLQFEQFLIQLQSKFDSNKSYILVVNFRFLFQLNSHSIQINHHCSNHKYIDILVEADHEGGEGGEEGEADADLAGGLDVVEGRCRGEVVAVDDAGGHEGADPEGVLRHCSICEITVT